MTESFLFVFRYPARLHSGVHLRADIALSAALNEPGGTAAAKPQDALPVAHEGDAGQRTSDLRQGAQARSARHRVELGPGDPVGAHDHQQRTAHHGEPEKQPVVVAEGFRGSSETQSGQDRQLALKFQVRRVRRCNSSSPDSDDTYGGEEDEVGLGKDDQYLVSDRTENKFYGSVHAAAAASSCGSAHQYPGNTPIIGPPLNYLQRRLQVG